ncbi:MAG: hypothetical protein RL358_1803, partial [Pseudomonadota bacterium]
SSRGVEGCVALMLVIDTHFLLVRLCTPRLLKGALR